MTRFLKVLTLVGIMHMLGLPTLGQANPTVIRVGAFFNVTHTQPMVGKATTWFEKAMGPNDMSQVLAVMILIIGLGYLVDGLVFRTIEKQLQEKWGLAPAS